MFGKRVPWDFLSGEEQEEVEEEYKLVQPRRARTAAQEEAAGKEALASGAAKKICALPA